MNINIDNSEDIVSCKINQKQSSTQLPDSKFQSIIKNILLKKIVSLSIIHIILITIWWNLKPIADFITYKIFLLNPTSKLAGSIHFFIQDMPFIFILLALIVFWMGILRSVLTPEKLRRLLVGKNQYLGNFIAAMIGSITPFCSCSAVPLFIGMMQARIPLGVTFTYLISSPMINEIAFILLWAIVGWQVALTYYVVGLIFALVAGIIIGKMKMEKYVEPWIYENDALLKESNCKNSCAGKKTNKNSWANRIIFAQNESIQMLKKVGTYIVIGIAIGAAIHGYVPASALSTVMGDTWWAVPVSVLIALPLYDNAGGVIPIVQALLLKGAALGTVLSFMMAITAMSFPELMILKKVMKLPLIATFVIVIAIGIITIGYFFNYLFSLGLIHIMH